MRRQKATIKQIVKDWNEATYQEIWEGVRDNFTFGFIGATLVVFIATRTDIAVLLGYVALLLLHGKNRESAKVRYQFG